MARKKNACKNHPKKLTVRRCFECKEAICTECQQTHEHHLFCSLTCYWKWKGRPLISRLRRYRMALFLVGLMVLSDWVWYLLPNDQNVAQSVVQADTASVLSDSAWIRPTGSYRPQGSRLHFTYQTNLNGQPFILWQNGRMAGTQTAANDQVDFPPLLLEPGVNRFTIRTLDEKGVSRLVDTFKVNFEVPQFRYLARQVSRVRTAEKVLAITFDGGSSNRITNAVLDTLKSRGVKCTMFLTGNFLKRFGPQVRRLVTDGHEVGNHSLSHPHLTTLEQNGQQQTLQHVDARFIQYQLATADSLFNQLTASAMYPFWRAPYGEVNQQILNWAALAGYKHINWSVQGDSWDWVADTTSTLYRTPEQILNHYLELEADRGLTGFILLWHLGSERTSDFPHTVLGKLIDTLRARGYRFVTISQLLQMENTRPLASGR